MVFILQRLKVKSIFHQFHPSIEIKTSFVTVTLLSLFIWDNLTTLDMGTDLELSIYVTGFPYEIIAELS